VDKKNEINVPEDEDNPYEASMNVTEFFRSLEECDSKRVDDFWGILDDTVLEFLNLGSIDGTKN